MLHALIQSKYIKMKQKSHSCGAVCTKISIIEECHTAEVHYRICLKHIMQEQNKSAVQFCYSIHPLWWGLIGSHLIWAFLCVDYSCHSISMCVCSHSSSIQSAFLSAFPPGQTVMCLSWPQTALRICSTATNTNRTLAWRRTAWLRSLWWWRTCERPTTNSLWLIKYTLFPFCCSSPSDCCLEWNVQLPKRTVQI